MFHGGITQEVFDREMQAQLDDMERHGVDIHACDSFRRQWQGGNCPDCGRPYKHVRAHRTAEGRDGNTVTLYDFEYYEPTCKCEETRDHAKTEEARIDRSLEAAGVPAKFIGCTFSSWDHDHASEEASRAKAQVVAWIEDEKYKSEGLFLHGEVGTGKTHCGIAALRELAAAEMSVLFVVTADLIDDMINKRRDISKELKAVDAVLFDDIDKLAVTDNEWVRSRIFSVFDKVSREQKTLIATSNVSTVQDLGEQFGKAVVSRWYEAASFVRFTGKNYRIIKRSKERQEAV
jgi:DNA replication protein DnaC